MEHLPVSPPYRRKITWRFRLVSVGIVGLIALREHLRDVLHLPFSPMPFEVLWSPPPRHESTDLTAVVELLNYAYVFLSALWIRDGCVLSLDLVGLRLKESRRQAERERKAVDALRETSPRVRSPAAFAWR